MEPGSETSAESGASDSPARESTPPAESGKSLVPSVQAHDFRNPTLLAPRELRKLRLHQEDFLHALAARLSAYLRLEVTLKLGGLHTVLYRKFSESWANPSCLTLFKIEPLRGVAILEIAPNLGFGMVDRLMGGSGRAPETVQEMSEIEKALLEQVIQLILLEWCSHWAAIKHLKHTVLGHESNGKFVQTAPPETVMLVLTLEAHMADITAPIQIGLPYVPIEPLIRQLSQGAETTAEAPVPALSRSAVKWNASFDDVSVPVIAEWSALELTTRDLLALKVGDVLRFVPQGDQQIVVRFGEIPKFHGRTGTIDGKWAIQLTGPVTT